MSKLPSPLLMPILSLLSLYALSACSKSTSDVAATAVPRVSCSDLLKTCNDPLPNLGPKRPFKHFHSTLITKTGSASHRARDIYTTVGKETWATAKFAYGLADADLKGEEVDVYIKGGCGKPWQKLGTFTTTEDDEHETVDGVEDTGGHVYINLAESLPSPLAVGHYQLFYAVAGDGTTVSANLEVLAPETKVLVTDVDGTLTSSELASATSLIGISPSAHPGAAELLTAFYRRGYFIYYLTARPEWMGKISHDWIKEKGFPPGLLNTTQFLGGAVGEAASQFKVEEMKLLREKTGIVPSFAFGNKESDVAAFAQAGIAPANSYYYKLDGDAGGGHIHSDYQGLWNAAAAAPAACY